MRSLRKTFAICSTIALTIGLVVASGDRAAADSTCDQRNPIADVFITVQQLTTTSLHAVVTNLGPCNVPDAMVSFGLPTGSLVNSIATLPSGWQCVGVGTSVATCGGPGRKAPAIGVPGNHDFFLTFTLGPGADQTLRAEVVVGGGSAACTDGNRNTTCDPYTDNNVLWIANIAATGGSLSTCPTQDCQQFADVTVGSGGTAGTVQTQLLQSPCPAGFTSCFGKLISITSAISGATWTKTFTIDLSLAHGPPTGIRLITTTDGITWTVVPLCTDTASLPCIQSRSFFTVGGVTYKRFVVISILDDSWGFDG